MGDLETDRVAQFTYRLTTLGPQWTSVDGAPYQCHTPVCRTKTCFIATTPFDHRLFLVNPFDGTAAVVGETDIPCGEVLPQERHIPVSALVQSVAEAWLRDESHGLQFYSQYVVLAFTGSRLVMGDELSASLIRLLNESGATEIAGRVDAYHTDRVGSPRLRVAWVQGVVELARVALLLYPE